MFIARSQGWRPMRVGIAQSPECPERAPRRESVSDVNWITGYIKDRFDAGDAAALDRLYTMLNEVLADLSIKRALLGVEPKPEPKERLEMVNQNKLDQEGFEFNNAWKARP